MTTKTLRVIAGASVVALLAATGIAFAASGGPTVVLSSTASSTTNLSSIPITATFSEPVGTFAASGIVATNGTVSGLSGSSTVFTFNLAPTAAGTTTVMIPADIASSTASSTGNQASNMLTFLSTMSTGTTTASTTPTISNVAVSDIGTNSATITWTTDIDSTSQVFYGTSASYGSMSALSSTTSMTHSVMLTGLDEATLYHFDVASTGTGGTATSSDMVFVTGSTASTTPLALTGITPVQANATADGTFADGWQWVLHFVVPTDEQFFSMKFADFTSSSSSSTIPAAGNIMFYSPEASDASTSASAILESGNNYTGVMMLSGDTASTTAGRQIDVYVNVAVPSGTPTGSYSTTFGAMSSTSSTTTP